MKASAITLLAAAAALALGATGCASDGDPHSGGLFGYSPSKYEQRISEKEQRLKAAEQEAQDESARTASLKQDRASLRSAIKRQGQQLKSGQTRLDKSLKALQGKADSGKVQDLKARSAELKRQSRAAEQIDDLEAKRAELRKLQQELRDLESEADALSRL
ncbi:MAG: hypothetical protein K6A65_05655 [Succinivibrionaceae bacterium]|nr:hypothetical protein [Succinivibrionaceae bacterium]